MSSAQLDAKSLRTGLGFMTWRFSFNISYLKLAAGSLGLFHHTITDAFKFLERNVFL